MGGTRGKGQPMKEQIRKMANDLRNAEHWYYDEISCTAELDEQKTAKNLYNAGYRKQIEGHWVSQDEAELMDRIDLAFTCSVCGHCDWDCTESETFNFCPNCGAKMKGTSDE